MTAPSFVDRLVEAGVEVPDSVRGLVARQRAVETMRVEVEGRLAAAWERWRSAAGGADADEVIAAHTDLSRLRAVAEDLPDVPAVPESLAWEVLKAAAAPVLAACATPLEIPAYAAETLHYSAEHMGGSVARLPHRIEAMQPSRSMFTHSVGDDLPPRCTAADEVAVAALETASAAGVALHELVAAALAFEPGGPSLSERVDIVLDARAQVGTLVELQRAAGEALVEADTERAAAGVEHRCRLRGGGIVARPDPVRCIASDRGDGHLAAPKAWVLRDECGPERFELIVGALTGAR